MLIKICDVFVSCGIDTACVIGLNISQHSFTYTDKGNYNTHIEMDRQDWKKAMFVDKEKLK